MMFIGVDPGVSGALALLDTKHNTLKIIQFPTFNISTSSGKNRSHLDHTQLAYTLFDLIRVGREENRPVRVVMEQVNAMPGQGVVSTFTFFCKDKLKTTELDVEQILNQLESDSDNTTY
ncbi:hypothetical protein EBZ39_05965 [bacterium]|nr:hypothetical protein [bacterium]